MTKSPTRGGCYQRHVLLLFCGGYDRSHGDSKRGISLGPFFFFICTSHTGIPANIFGHHIPRMVAWMDSGIPDDDYFMMEIHFERMQNDWIGMEWTMWLWFFFSSVTKCIIAGADRHRIKISVVVAARSHRTAIKQQKPQKKKKPPSVVGQTWSNDWNLIDTMTIAITWEMKMVIIWKGGDSQQWSYSSNNIIERQRKIN